MYKRQDRYYKKIISSIIEIKRADAFIIALSNLIRRMAVDHLHILGDIDVYKRQGYMFMVCIY